MKVLLIIEQCNPELASVPLVSYNLFDEISKLVDVTLVTHIRNRNALERTRRGRRIEYIEELSWIRSYYRLTKKIISLNKGMNWPLKHSLTYPVYWNFNHKVNKYYRPKVLANEYDIVHVITPMIPRYPVKIAAACKDTPFIMGPVNGGVPFPSGFQKVARKEYAHLNFLRLFSRCIPGYSGTYKNADRILSGSTYTLNMLKDMFRPSQLKIELFFENGIKKEFLHFPRNDQKKIFNLLFVGRLVPYKAADMVIEAIGRLDDKMKKKIRLTLVGDGPERSTLEKQADRLGIRALVCFSGWVNQDETVKYYKASDIFCFPSVREFGGAVVLEAMACGLPCIVADQGGIGEYVTDKTGFKIKPLSKEYMINELANKINFLLTDNNLYNRISYNAFERATEFEWSRKAERIVDIYKEEIELMKNPDSQAAQSLFKSPVPLPGEIHHRTDTF